MAVVCNLAAKATTELHAVQADDMVRLSVIRWPYSQMTATGCMQQVGIKKQGHAGF